jgi:hypothetical protein
MVRIGEIYPDIAGTAPPSIAQYEPSKPRIEWDVMVISYVSRADFHYKHACLEASTKCCGTWILQGTVEVPQTPNFYRQTISRTRR